MDLDVCVAPDLQGSGVTALHGHELGERVCKDPDGFTTEGATACDRAGHLHDRRNGGCLLDPGAWMCLVADRVVDAVVTIDVGHHCGKPARAVGQADVRFGAVVM